MAIDTVINDQFTVQIACKIVLKTTQVDIVLHCAIYTADKNTQY